MRYLAPSSRLENDNRLIRCDFSEGVKESTAILQTFDIGADYLGLFIGSQILQYITLIDIQGITVTEQLAEASSALGRIVNKLRSRAATLHEHADISRF